MTQSYRRRPCRLVTSLGLLRNERFLRLLLELVKLKANRNTLCFMFLGGSIELEKMTNQTARVAGARKRARVPASPPGFSRCERHSPAAHVQLYYSRSILRVCSSIKAATKTSGMPARRRALC